MRPYNELSSFRDSIRLLAWTYTALYRVPKMYRHPLLERLRQGLIELLLSIRDVTIEADKEAAIARCRQHLAYVEIVFMVLFEVGAINNKQLTYATAEVANLSKQFVGWLASLQERRKKKEQEDKENKGDKLTSTQKQK